MSIQTELSRIINAKAAIKAAIEGKGVTVPEATLLDGMASLIDSIEAGGGGESNIVVGSFTLINDLTTDSPLYIDVPFPKNEFPLMYCVFEDTSNLADYNSSTSKYRLRNLVSSRVPHNFYVKFYNIAAYNEANSTNMSVATNLITHTDSGYDTGGGVQGSMKVSLKDNQIQFNAVNNKGPYLVGRTYLYILYWGD